jgi:hypothetical protein
MTAFINEFAIDNNKTVIVRCRFVEQEDEEENIEMTVSEGSNVWFAECKVPFLR